MDWFLYDNGLRLERVKCSNQNARAQTGLYIRDCFFTTCTQQVGRAIV